MTENMVEQLPAQGAGFGAAATVSTVPAAARAKLRDRLKARKPERVTVDLGGGDVVEVRGMDMVAAAEMQTKMVEEEGPDADPDAPPDMLKANPRMLRMMCWDPEIDEKVFGTGEIVGYADDDRTIPIIDGLTDEEINGMPIGDVNRLMQAVNKVMGRDGEPGKGSPSTADGGTSSP